MESDELSHSRSSTLHHAHASLPNALEPERQFILTFESLPELWDTTNPQYTNKYKRNENLAKLLPILKKTRANATLEDVKKKINTIRSNYRRELKKISVSKASGAGTGEIYSPKVWYFPYLHFLTKLDQPVPLKQESELAEQSQPTPQSSQQLKEVTKKRLFPSISTVLKPSAHSTTKRKKLNSDEPLERACRCLSGPCYQSSQQVNLSNPIALEWSNTLGRLDPVQRLYAKKAINDILFEAELGNLDGNSVRINDSPPLSPSSQ